MRILALLFSSLLIFSCKKSADEVIKLLRTEAPDNYGNILYTVYGYDNANRIVSITQNQNNAVAAVLNEYMLYYESPFNSNYKNMPDQVTRSTTDKDKNGVIIFSGTSITDIDRTYNEEGLLSAANIPSQNTPYKVINYFYGK